MDLRPKIKEEEKKNSIKTMLIQLVLPYTAKRKAQGYHQLCFEAYKILDDL